MTIIHETIAGYRDRASVNEDELGEEENSYAERCDWAGGEI